MWSFVLSPCVIVDYRILLSSTRSVSPVVVGRSANLQAELDVLRDAFHRADPESAHVLRTHRLEGSPCRSAASEREHAEADARGSGGPLGIGHERREGGPRPAPTEPTPPT